MKHLILILSLLPLGAAAQRVPSPLARFYKQMTYIVDGESMYVNCRCNLDQTKSFDIGVEASFEALPQAAEAAFAVANDYCAVRFDSAVSTEGRGQNYPVVMTYSDEGVWLLVGNCV